MVMKKYWIVRATLIETGYNLLDENKTRSRARNLKKVLSVSGK